MSEYIKDDGLEMWLWRRNLIVQDYSAVAIARRDFAADKTMGAAVMAIKSASLQRLSDFFERSWGVTFGDAEKAVEARGPVALFDFVKENDDE